jgi:cold shock CspA family protein
MQGTYTGSITVFDFPRGWGYITRDDGQRVYFHVKNKIRTFLPALDARVEFEMGPAYKSGLPDQAVNLRDVRPDGGSR